MATRRVLPPAHPAFAALPVRLVTVGAGRARMAVHVAGQLGGDRTPVICIPGYQRNMSDFIGFVGEVKRLLDPTWPVVLVDLLGRGRSADRPRGEEYASTRDAADVAAVTDALGIENAVYLGQGHGGQVVTALSLIRPALIAGAVLIDTGPMADPRALVRLRNNLGDIHSLRGETAFRRMMRQMLASDYPSVSDEQFEELTLRTHFLDKRGRVRPLFDQRLIAMLAEFEHDDLLTPQWHLFGGLGVAPLLLMRTQFTEQVRREIFEEMMRRRRDAEAFIIDGQGSPALLDNVEDVRPITAFVEKAAQWRRRFANAS